MERLSKILFLVSALVLLITFGFVAYRKSLNSPNFFKSVNTVKLPFSNQTSGLKPDEMMPARILDGQVTNVKDGLLVVSVNVKRIFPTAPINIKDVNIYVSKETTYVLANRTTNVTSSIGQGNVANGDSVSILIASNESNRDILKSDSYHADKVSVVR